MPQEVTNRFYAETEHQQDLWKARMENGLPSHVSPYSVLIAAMGQHWRPGSLEAVTALAQATFDAGYTVCFYEEPDRCYTPYDALGVMRNLAYYRALEEGWEYLLYVDNDVIPQPDALVRLLRRHVPLISPIVSYADGQPYGLTLPQMERGRGLAMVSSCVLSFLLFNAAVLRPYALSPFWQDALGADEFYHFAKLRTGTGHRPFVDSDVEVICSDPPHYPLDHKGEMRTPSPPAKKGPQIWTP